MPPGSRAIGRVWVDAQLPPALDRWLAQEHGVEARHIFDEGLIGADDPPIFEAARARGVSAVITKDEDFVRIVENRGPPPQVIWVTIGNVRNAELRRIMMAAWSDVAALLSEGEPLVEVGRLSDR